MKKVSVIVPVYGVEDYIIKCIDSILNQTLKDIELIVINDGTEDNSIRLIKENFDDNERENYRCIENAYNFLQHKKRIL